jgi:hypothetical protein
MKTLYSFLVALVLLVGGTSSAFAYSYAVGDGSSGNPYRITDRAGLEGIADDLTAEYKLTADIDLAGAAWTPLGAFTGTLDGNGNAIQNISINVTGNAGLFSELGANASITNVQIVGGSITTSGTFAGSIAGSISGSATITKSSNSANITSTSTSSAVGGLVGGTTTATGSVTISSSSNTGTVSAAGLYVGGIFGASNGSTATGSVTITDCYNTGVVSTSNTGNAYVGAIAGYVYYSNPASVQNCYATGSLSSKYASGMVGRIKNAASSTISNNIALMSGITGDTSHAHPILGYNAETAVVTNNYANSGDMTGISGTVASAARQNGSTVSLANAKTAAWYATNLLTWNFINVWEITDDNLPTLREVNGDNDGGVTPPPGDTYTVTFTVNIPDAVVKLDAIINPAGNYVFTEIAPGYHTYSVAKAGYETKTGGVTVTDANVEVPLITLTEASANVKYVVPGGAGAKDGSSWDNAFESIAAAYAAVTAPGEVHVKVGSYPFGSINPLRSGVHLKGGYTGVGDTKAVVDPADPATQTVWNGGTTSSGNRFITATSGAALTQETVISGITFQDNLCTAQGAVILRANATLENCIVKNNTSSGSGGNGAGGVAIMPDVAGPVKISNCKIIGNHHTGTTANFGGGGVEISSGTAATVITIENTEITGNNSTLTGGGIHAYIASASAKYTLEVNNCLIANNTAAGNGDGIHIANFAAAAVNIKVVNSTIVKNDVYIGSAASPYVYIYNSILGEAITNGQAGNIVNNIVPALTDVVTAENNNIAANAGSLFVDYIGGNYRLQPTSAAINAGSEVAGQFTTTDILGRGIQGAKRDIGAYERYDGDGDYIVPVTYTVTFNVVDALDAPVADAVVTLNGVANAANNYVFTDILAGSYNYSVAKTGYKTKKSSVTITSANVEEKVTLVEDDGSGEVLGTITAGHPDGPYIFYTADGVKVITVDEEGTVTQTVYPGTKLPTGTTFDVYSDANDPTTGQRSHFTVTIQDQLSRPPGVDQSRDSLIVLSDVHAKWGPFVNILKSQHVIDNNLNWAFGSNALMLIGDICDRGVDATTCYWFIYELQRQARAAGGQVYFNLGNHDEMRAKGTSIADYVDGKYTRLATFMGTAGRLGTAYSGFAANWFDGNTEIGRFFRDGAEVIQIVGREMYMHGGISPSVYNLRMGIDEINTAVAAQFLGTTRTGNVATLLNSTMTGITAGGLLWYRGMVQTAAYNMDILTPILQFYKIERVVIGHCEVQASSGIQTSTSAALAYTRFDNRVVNVNVPTDVAYNNNYGRGALILKDGRTFAIYDTKNNTPKANTTVPVWSTVIPGTTPEPDEDGDGVPDAVDECPGTPTGTKVDAKGCPFIDTDGDGVPDDIDQCPNTPTGDKVDANGCTIIPPPIPAYADFLGNYTITYGTTYTDPVLKPYTLNVELVEGVAGQSYFLKGLLKNEAIGNIVLKYDAAVGFTFEAHKLGVNPANTAKDIWAAGQYQNRNTNSTSPAYGCATTDFDISNGGLKFTLGHWKGTNSDDVSIGIYLRALDTGTTANSVVYTGGSNSAATGEDNARFYYISFEKTTTVDVKSTVVDDAVISTKYYNLQGQLVGEQNFVPTQTGIYIVKNIHASGKVSTTKELKISK